MSTYTELLMLRENLTDGDEFMCLVCDNLELPLARTAIKHEMKLLAREHAITGRICLISLYGDILDTFVNDFDPEYLKFRQEFLNKLIAKHKE